MTGGKAAVQGRRPLQFCRDPEAAAQPILFVLAQQNRFLRRRFAALPAAPPAAL